MSITDDVLKSIGISREEVKEATKDITPPIKTRNVKYYCNKCNEWYTTTVQDNKTYGGNNQYCGCGEKMTRYIRRKKKK